jgi:RHS repeat-associated protein
MQMQLASESVLSQPPLAAMPQLSEKPRLGFATKKTAWNPGPNVCNFTVTLGLQVVVSENGVRKTYSARYYNPNTGRFMSRDPEAGSRVDPASLHKYLYAGANPVNRIDPLGRKTEGEYEEIVGIDGEIAEELEEKEVPEAFANKFTEIDDAFDQLESLEDNQSYQDPGYFPSSAKSLQALINAALKFR